MGDFFILYNYAILEILFLEYHMPHGPTYHIHRRKRVYQTQNVKQQYQPYPHPDKFKAFVDRIIYVIGILAPLAGSAQAIKIYTEKNAAGVSLIHFGANVFFNLIWITYGFLHKEKPIIITYLLWFCINVLVSIGIFLYR